MRSGGTTSQTDLRTLAKFQNEENENIKDPKMVSDKAVDSSSIQDLLQSLDSEPETVVRHHFKRFIEDASQPRHISGNACIKLCYFLEQCRKSKSSNLRSVAYSRETCQDLFDFYVEWNEKNQHRSMRQVLELLASLISLNPDKAAANDFKIEALNRLVSIITHQSAQPLVKPAFKMLEYFLSRSTFELSELFEVYSHVCGNGDLTLSSAQEIQNDIQWDRFVSDVFEWMSLPDTSSAAGKLLVSLFGALKTSPIGKSEVSRSYSAYWQRWIQQGLDKHPESLENVKNYLFPPLFKLDRLGSLEFLRNLSEHNPIDLIGSQKIDSHAPLLLSAMEVGKKLGLVDDPDIFPPQKASAKKRDFVALPSKVIGDLLKHTASSVRSSAFSVLVLSLSSTKPFPSESLDVIRQNLFILHADTDAKFRNELFTNTKHMLERLRGALALLNREIGLNAAKEQALSNGTSKTEEVERKGEDLLKHVQEHNKFLYWYLDFLAKELVPTASYQRHITSLKSLEILLKTGVQASPSISALSTSHGSDTCWPQQINIFSPSLVRLLLDLVLDPFEEVRNCSVSVLNFAPKESFGPLIDTSYGSVPKLLQDLVSKAKIASSQTGRADMADGLAHIHVLEYQLLSTNQQRLQLFELHLSALEGDVFRASKDLEAVYTPIHAHLATLRQVWQLISPDSYEGIVANNTTSSDLGWTIHTLQDRLVKCCVNIWDVVKDVLCNDSPEGHIPKFSETLTNADAKEVSSNSFRACHESSLLIQAIVSKLTIKSSKESPFLAFNLFQQVGNLTFEQLSTLRHRGAFSTVAGTFTQCCKLTQHASIVENGGAALLLDWYNGALACIDEQNSTTRRSAGIPALMTGILSASSPVVTFDSVMQKLQSIARAPVIDTGKDEVQLSQVHAMNSLKDIFKSATLGKKADIYVTDCFLIAADSLKSKIWAISNCGLLLLKSLMDCMLGTSESKEATEAGWDGRSIRISYDRYPKLPELLIRLLSSEITDSADAKEVFPALEFLRRVGPPEKDRAQFREKFFAHVIKHLNCSTWDVRDLAARTACTFLLDDDWVTTVVELLNPNQTSSNGLQGILLLIKYLMQKRYDLDKETTTDDLLEMLKAMSFICLKHGEYPTDGALLASYEECLFPIYAIILKTSPPQTHAVHGFLGSNSENPRTILNAIFASMEEMRVRNPDFSVDASLSKVYALHYLYVLRLENRLEDLVKGTRHWNVDEMDPDLATEILDKILIILDLKTLSTEDRINLVSFFHKFGRVSWPGKVQAAALRCISVVLGFMDYASLTDDQLRRLLEWLANPLFLDNADKHFEPVNGFVVSVIYSPDLENAIIQAKGAIFRLKIHTYERQLLSSDPVVRKDEFKKLSKQILEFGKGVLYALTNDQDFDARLSALEAIQNFYGLNSHFTPFLPALLYLNLALLASLSDDDDEIRHHSAFTVSILTTESEVPEAAVGTFAVWMCDKYQTDENFLAAVVRKVTTGKGQCELTPYNNVEDELADALIEDNSLFVEEEQNLYIDEVREARMWITMLMRGQEEHWDYAQGRVSLWSLRGLDAIERQAAKKIDGPFGWTSRPQVFAICARVILAARAECGHLDIREGRNSEQVVILDLLREGRRLWEVGSKNDFHPLLLEHLKWFADMANGLGLEEEDE